ncbi:MAG: cytochrome bd ubiquinol oxidase subunit [Solirubrobacteraceae bacterium]|nr:cytochrome bd ubiquinol oxidase subunit [Solirubrobacteraceae bacterium]
MSTVAALTLWTAITAYVVFGGADFGAGIWDLVPGSGDRGLRARELADTAITPVWEANHVWIIFALVVCWTAFSQAFAAILSTLWIPFMLALLGIVGRGSGFAFRHALSGRAGELSGRLFAASSAVAPFFLGAAFGGIASGRVPLGNAAGDPLTSWLNPTSIVVGVLAVLTCAYLAAVFLIHDARRMGDEELAVVFTQRATGAAAATGALAIAGVFVLRSDAEYVGDRLTTDALPLIAVSVLAGAANLALLRRGARRGTRQLAVLAVAAVVWAWAVAQAPYLLPTSLTVSAAAAPDTTLTWLLAISIVALVVVGASLALLFALHRRSLLDSAQPDPMLGGP